MVKKDLSVVDAMRVLMGAEYRSMGSWQEKAVSLSRAYSVSQRVLASALGVGVMSVERCLKAADDGRVLGRWGRPRLLTDDEEDRVLTEILAAEARGDSMAPSDVRQAVSVAQYHAQAW